MSSIDETVVFSTFQQHQERLEVVLQLLQKEGLKFKLPKDYFFQQEFSYLGHAISAKRATGTAKVEVVAN